MTSNLLAALKSNQGKPSTSQVNPLIKAARDDDVVGCGKALDDPKVKVDGKDGDGVTALMHAAHMNHINVVRFLVERGARISIRDEMGETAFMKACKEGHLAVISYLKEQQLAQKKKGGPLGGGDVEKQMALENKRVLDAKDDEGITALMKAAEQGEFDAVKLLLDDGASLNIKDDEGWNVLMWAALAGNLEIVEMLVDQYDMEPTYATEKGENALMKAAAGGSWEVCQYLLNKGSKVNTPDNEGQTALMWAAAEGYLQVVKGLVEAKQQDTKVNLETKLKKTTLLLAAQFGREEICKFLIAQQAKVDQQDSEGQTALFGAAQSGNHSLVEILIEKKCPLEAKTKAGQTALMWAVIHQQLQCVQTLVNAKADIHVADDTGTKASDLAEGTLNSHVVEVLREAAKAMPEAKDE